MVILVAEVCSATMVFQYVAGLGMEYAAMTRGVTWVKASSSCASAGGRLAKIDSWQTVDVLEQNGFL